VASEQPSAPAPEGVAEPSPASARRQPEPPGRPPRRRWAYAVPVVALVAGLLFAATGAAAGGTDLRGADRGDLVGLVRAEQARAADAAALVKQLRAQVEATSDHEAADDVRVAAERSQVDAVLGAAGMQEVSGAGITVTLDDAPRPADGFVGLGDEASPNDLVVHQQDLQAVVNALWAAGAEGIQLMDQRVISTSAVRCVGPVLFLQGRIYAPPYVVTAVGDPEAMRVALAGSPGVQAYRYAADRFGLVYTEEEQEQVSVAAYSGTVELAYARVAGADTGTGGGAGGRGPTEPAVPEPSETPDLRTLPAPRGGRG
jgi:uncharacterized protein YlxW (UPF0749 family)